MRMRKTSCAAVAVALLFAIACASSTASGPQPKIEVRTVKVPESRAAGADEFSTMLELEITNPTAETLTVDRIQLASVSSGTYTVAPATERPQKQIAPGGTEVFRVWAQVSRQATASEGLDPILLRGSVEFLGASGGFRRTFTKQVNPSTVR
jgi:hypothetical protein